MGILNSTGKWKLQNFKLDKFQTLCILTFYGQSIPVDNLNMCSGVVFASEYFLVEH